MRTLRKNLTIKKTPRNEAFWIERKQRESEVETNVLPIPHQTNERECKKSCFPSSAKECILWGIFTVSFSNKNCIYIEAHQIKYTEHNPKNQPPIDDKTNSCCHLNHYV